MRQHQYQNPGRLYGHLNSTQIRDQVKGEEIHWMAFVLEKQALMSHLTSHGRMYQQVQHLLNFALLPTRPELLTACLMRCSDKTAVWLQQSVESSIPKLVFLFARRSQSSIQASAASDIYHEKLSRPGI